MQTNLERKNMTRDWEVIREILLKLEACTTANTNLNAKTINGFPEQAVAYNMRLLSEAGFIEAKIMSSSSGDGKINAALATRLTNSGHDLLDTIRNDSVWGKVKEKFVSSGIDMTFELVTSVGKRIMEAMLS
ncbi:MAG: DUF2513 domain-containing protein [Methylotenera sp.]|uniref:DUF2513 domain-containing protein n=1 Tax=Methylotenera sp. TaxID=2051956 RepID=UPI002731C5C0|nr:DUF2513 domain-containing protein [Methylotenera sp.]MDP1523823.1 DUF2513 domain-containing protein [Methylotenera sp.]